MGAFDMIGRLILSTTRWDEAIGRADAKATAFADKVEHKLSKKISKYFGAGFVAGMIISPLHQAAKALFEGPVERAKKIDEEAKSLGVTAEQYQMIEAAANAAHKSVHDWIEEVKQHKVPLEDAIKTLGKYKDKVDLTGGDIRWILNNGAIGDIMKHIGKANVNLGRYIHESDVAMNLSPIAGHGFFWRIFHPGAVAQAMAMARAGIDKFENAPGTDLNDPKLMEALSGSRQKSYSVNEWQRIGDYVGSSDTTEKLDEIVKNTRQTAENTSRLPNGVTMTNGYLSSDSGPIDKLIGF